MVNNSDILSEELKDVKIIKSRNGIKTSTVDQLIKEEPLEIQLCESGTRPAQSLSVTMRTPGVDRALALGFLFSEGIIKSADAFSHIAFPAENIIRLFYDDASQIDLTSADRNFYTTSSCGVCGKSSIKAIQTKNNFDIKSNKLSIKADLISNFKTQLFSSQQFFNKTGGNHAAALFDTNGEMLLLCEDVGRHNAMDKIIGFCLLENKISLPDAILVLSGRSSFELIQKASTVAIPIIISIGAPSSLAYELADTNGQTLIGFLKEDSYNIYTHAHRITD